MTNLDLQSFPDTPGARKCKHFVKLKLARVPNMEELLPTLVKRIEETLVKSVYVYGDTISRARD